MKLIVGLGNPGKKYKNTRHNIGFEILDSIASNEKFSSWKKKLKFHAEISEGSIVAEKILLAKPLAYMNNSGQAVSAIAQYCKISPRDIVVIHDDLDLPIGTLRISQNSSSGGHKGVQSIIDALGTEEFARLRLGICGENRAHTPAEEYVLENFTSEEKIKIEDAAKLLIEALEQVISVGAVEAMNEFN